MSARINFKAEEYITKIPKDAEESSKLIEAGFDFVLTTPDGQIIFKRK
jgi:hypothetical protein